MKPVFHVAASTLVSGILYVLFKSWGLVIASFLSGILIDIDHVIDYLIVRGVRCDRKEFSKFIIEKECWKTASRHWKLNVLFHGWELLVILSIAAALTDWNPVVTGILIGFGHHILLDVFNNKRDSLSKTFLGYSLLWRWKNSS
jgi:hypothetical protein